MRRTHRILLSAALLFGLVACGSGGTGGKGPPGGATHENGGRPVANGWDPFAPAGDPSPSGTDFPACSSESTITVSQVFDTILLPVCNMAALCGGNTSDPQTPDTPQPGTPSENSSVRAGDLTGGGAGMPASCGDIFEDADFDIESDGFAGVCEIFQKISDALKQHPECNPPIVVPAGLCMNALSACINDIVALGCNPTMSEPPRSCVGISFGDTGSTPTPPPTDPCQECLEGCNSDSDCMLACFEDGICQQD